MVHVDYCYGKKKQEKGFNGKPYYFIDKRAYNSCSGGLLYIKYSLKNYSRKSIKKVKIYFNAYNVNGEVEKFEFERDVSYLSSDGITKYGLGTYQTSSEYYSCDYTIYKIKSLEIDHIDVTYMNNTKETFKGNYSPTALDIEEEKKEEKETTKFMIFILSLAFLSLWGIIKYLIWFVSDMIGLWYRYLGVYCGFYASFINFIKNLSVYTEGFFLFFQKTLDKYGKVWYTT